MQSIRVGLSRLYNANACSNLGGEAILLRFPLGSIEVEAYIGPEPRYIIGTWTIGPPTPQDPAAKTDKPEGREDVVPSRERFPADFYTELLAVQRIDVDDDLTLAFQTGDKEARDKILQMTQQYQSFFTTALDCVAGILGLRLHYLLVTTPITEQIYAFRDNGKPYSFGTSLPVNITESYGLDVSSAGLQTIRSRLPQIERRWKWEKAAEILAWLLRAWAAEDSVLRFVSLFIPLECVIPNVLPTEKKAWEQERESLLALIHEDSRTGHASVLRDFVAELRFQSPSIASRFEKWADLAALSGWEEDVVAFRRFLKMRNSLVHAGDRRVKSHVTVSVNDVRSLEDITERYVSLALFGDANVYQTRKRKDPSQGR